VLWGNTVITVDDDFSQDEMMCGLVQQAVQEAFKTEVQKFDEELGNDYEANQHVYRAMIAQMNREEREDEEGS
jgi:mannose/fructose/N-acetylgalactosamine-specific phosphotransferase system component IIB